MRHLCMYMSEVSKSCCFFFFQHFCKQTVKKGNNSEEETLNHSHNGVTVGLKWNFVVGFLFYKTSSERVKSVGQSLVKADSSKGGLSSFPQYRHRNVFLRVGILRDEEIAQRTRNISSHQDVSTLQLNSFQFIFISMFWGAVVCLASAHIYSAFTSLHFVNKPQTI